MEIVIDTSAVMAVLLGEPERPALIAATKGALLLAPLSLPWEVGNALVATVRRRRLSAAEAAAGWAAFQKVTIRLVDVDIAQAIAIANTCGVYAYDAYMLELARSRRLSLLTLDGWLSQVARRVGIESMAIE